MGPFDSPDFPTDSHAAMLEQTDRRAPLQVIRERLSSLLHGRLGRGVIATMASQVLAVAMTLCVTLFLPAYLGDLNLGKLTLAIGFAAIFAIFVNFGTSTVLVQDVAKNPGLTRHLVRTTFRLRLMLAVATWIVGVAASFLLGYDGSVRLVVMLVLTGTICGQIADTFQSALSGLQEFVKQSSAGLTERLTFGAVTIALVFAKAPLWAFGLVYVLSNSVLCVVSGALLRRALRTLPPPHGNEPPKDTLGTARAGIPFVTPRIFGAIYGDGSSALLMSKLASLEAIGWFGLAKRFAGATQVLPVSVATVMLPRLTQLHHNGDRAGFTRMVRRMIAVLVLASLPFTILLTLFPAQILRLLHYPAGYAGSIPVLRVAGGALCLWFVQQALGTACIAAGKQATLAYASGLAAILAIPVCGGAIWAGTHYAGNGALGAMVGDVILEGVMMIFFIRALRPVLAASAPSGTA